MVCVYVHYWFVYMINLVHVHVYADRQGNESKAKVRRQTVKKNTELPRTGFKPMTTGLLVMYL